MPESESEIGLEPAGVHAARIRKIGLLFLFAGMVLGGLIYIFGPAEASPEDNDLLTEYYKKQDLETQKMWGNLGPVVLGVTRSFKHASTYAIIVAAMGGLAALACFFHASHLPEDG